MALFGLFKSKEERALGDTLQNIQAAIFPGGEADIVRDCERVDTLTNGKISRDKLRGFVGGCKALLHISASDSDDRFYSEFREKSGGSDHRIRGLCDLCLS